MISKNQKKKQNPLLQKLSDEDHEINSTNTDISKLLAELCRYSNKILADEALMNQLVLYIDLLTKFIPVNEFLEESIFSELTFGA